MQPSMFLYQMLKDMQTKTQLKEDGYVKIFLLCGSEKQVTALFFQQRPNTEIRNG